MVKLSTSEIAEALKSLQGWSLVEGKLIKQFVFANFSDVITCMVKIGFIAEAKDHHPDMSISYRRLTFILSTHTAKGVTQKDIELAHEIERELSKYHPAQAS